MVANSQNASQTELQQAIDKLQENIEEFHRQYKLQRRRRILKFLLIGFLIGRNSDKRIVELNVRNKRIIKNIAGHIDELDIRVNSLGERIREFAETYTHLKSIVEKVKDFDKGFKQAQATVLTLEKDIAKHREFLLTYLKKAVEQRTTSLAREVSKVEDGDTYLIFTEKQQLIGKIDSLKEATVGVEG